VACDPLPYDTSCLPSGWGDELSELTPAQRSAYDFAAEMITGLTLGVYGLCTRVARPCSAACATRAGYSRDGRGWYMPLLYDGQVYNTCGCGPHLTCGCGDTRAAVMLDGRVDSITQVRIDGAVLSPSAYVLDRHTLLVRVDGGVWPLVQDLNAPATADNTFEVTYKQGAPLPAGGRRSLTALMVELFKARCGDASCRLPARVTNIVREGVTYSMLDDPAAILDAGRTGITEVDMWIALVNPSGTRTRMRVYSPDLPTRGR
jgi:hypothetical protein